jgi:uncharacterized protein involved in type VI secretion and phage assembly
VNGRDDELRSMQDELARSARERHQHLGGIFRGKVVTLGSKASGHEGRLGQLQISIPEIWGDNTTEVPWADPVVPFAGDGYGALTLPRVGDGVYVMFEGGSPDNPVWMGGFWSEDAKLPEPASADARVLRSPKGHRLVLDDAKDEIRMTHASGSQITIGKSQITIEIDGGSKIVIGKASVAINGTALVVDK